MNILSLNVDEILYRIHISIMEPLWHLISFRWVWDPSGGGLFSSTFGRFFDSRPSARADELEGFGFFDYLGSLLFDSGSGDSIFSLLFGSLFSWFLLLAILAGLLWWFFHQKLHFLSEREVLIHDTVIARKEKEVSNDKATRWQQILDNLNSGNQNSWKIAVMDADIMLDEVLDEQGYTGTGVGDKLKKVGPEYASAVQFAWKGHITRNKVAHDPKFELSERDARLAISMYERFFAAFYSA